MGGCSGGDNVSINSFQPGAAKRLTDLSIAMRDGNLRLKPYRLIDIAKKKGGHRRLLIRPNQPERVYLAS